MPHPKGQPLSEATKARLREANLRRLEDPEERERARAQMLHARSFKRDAAPAAGVASSEPFSSPMLAQQISRPFRADRIMVTAGTMPVRSCQPIFSAPAPPLPTAPLPAGWGLRRHLPGTGGSDWWTGGFVETIDERGRPATVPAFGPAHDARPFPTEAAALDFRRFERPLRGLSAERIA